jgi:hypothetical protein
MYIQTIDALRCIVLRHIVFEGRAIAIRPVRYEDRNHNANVNPPATKAENFMPRVRNRDQYTGEEKIPSRRHRQPSMHTCISGHIIIRGTRGREKKVTCLGEI